MSIQKEERRKTRQNKSKTMVLRTFRKVDLTRANVFKNWENVFNFDKEPLFEKLMSKISKFLFF